MSKATDLRQDRVIITLDKERTLLFDLNTMVDLEEEYGDINAAFKEITSGKMKSVRKILWFGLKHEDENLTEKQVGALIPFKRVEEVADKLMSALSNSMPEVDEKNK